MLSLILISSKSKPDREGYVDPKGVVYELDGKIIHTTKEKISYVVLDKNPPQPPWYVPPAPPPPPPGNVEVYLDTRGFLSRITDAEWVAIRALLSSKTAGVAETVGQFLYWLSASNELYLPDAALTHYLNLFTTPTYSSVLSAARVTQITTTDILGVHEIPYRLRSF